MNVFEQIRKEYEARGIDRGDLSDCPIEQFKIWFREAVDKSPGKWLEPNAMTLSTFADGWVTSRTVLLKEFDSGRFVFFTNYDSEKGRQLKVNPVASLLFHWPYLGRQIRINGNVEKSSREKSREYFHSRPRGAQLGAAASDQSSELEERKQLDSLKQQLEQKLNGSEVPLPEFWGGYEVIPHRFEFWQGRLDRLHDRFQYSRVSSNDAGTGSSGLNAAESANVWDVQRLFP